MKEKNHTSCLFYEYQMLCSHWNCVRDMSSYHYQVITIKLKSNHKSRINSIGSAPFLTDTVQVTINPQIIEYLSHLRFAHRNSYNANLPARQRPSLEFGISYVSYAMFYLPWFCKFALYVISVTSDIMCGK